MIQPHTKEVCEFKKIMSSNNAYNINYAEEKVKVSHNRLKWPKGFQVG
jgi:hypothetical protein